MSRFAIIYKDDRFRVHCAGCCDIGREAKDATSVYPVEADTAEQAVAEDQAAYNDQGQGFTRANYTILPCCK